MTTTGEVAARICNQAYERDLSLKQVVENPPDWFDQEQVECAAYLRSQWTQHAAWKAAEEAKRVKEARGES